MPFHEVVNVVGAQPEVPLIELGMEFGEVPPSVAFLCGVQRREQGLRVHVGQSTQVPHSKREHSSFIKVVKDVLDEVAVTGFQNDLKQKWRNGLTTRHFQV